MPFNVQVNHVIGLDSPTLAVLRALAAAIAPSPDPAILSRLDAMEARIMSAIASRLDELEAAQQGMEARVTTHLDGLKAAVADLQARVDAGTATPDEVARLDALTRRIRAFDPTDPTTLPADAVAATANA
jgi:hypothetical protein